MMRRIFFSVALLFVSAGLALSSDKPLTANEIEELLTGNTVDGIWAGSTYKQYFDASGTTIYVPAGGNADEGKWRVNEAENTYESWWTAADWTGYGVVRSGENYAFTDQAGDTHPFVLLEGNQID